MINGENKVVSIFSSAYEISRNSKQEARTKMTRSQIDKIGGRDEFGIGRVHLVFFSVDAKVSDKLSLGYGWY